MAADWIQKRKAASEQRKQETHLEDARDRLATQTIKVDGPVFWELLLPELNEQCADMEDIGFQAKAYSLDNPHYPDEKTYRIDVQTKGHWPCDAHASLIHFTGSSLIRVSSNIPKLTEITLCVTERGVRAISNKDTWPMDAIALAGYLLEGLVGAIEREKNR